MTEYRAHLLGELLEELSEDPRGFIPEAAWAAVQRTFALPYIELAVVRRLESNVQILLSYRDDKDWCGWHIPGGLWRTRQTLVEGIAVLAKAELGTSVEVKFLTKGTWEKWKDHPYGFPISHIVICSATGIAETENLRWFSEVPEGIIEDGGHHARYIKSIFRQVEEQKLLG